MRHLTKKGSVAVIGAGPSGLAAACALSHHGVAVTVYEAGKTLSERCHENATDLATGIGGVGLFSDGKFSFYPSGTHVYRLTYNERLRKAYHWMSLRLQSVGIKVEPFPHEIPRHRQIKQLIKEKKYPSHHSSLGQRKELVNQLSKAVAGPILTNTRVEGITPISGGYLVEARDNRTGKVDTLPVSGVVIATGRLGCLNKSKADIFKIIPMKEVRYEFGVRIECHHSVGFLNRRNQLDVKCLWQCGPAQIRTFCTCRQGEAWNIPYDILSAISGRADGPSTEFSNFGILARFEGSSLKVGKEIWNDLRSRHTGKAIWEPLGGFLQDPSFNTNQLNISSRPWFPLENFQRGEIREYMGHRLYSIIEAAIRDLLAWSPDLADPQTVCLFPMIEGTGFYPDLDKNLKVKGHKIWCAGDIGGRFRGLVPALLSGYYSGLSVHTA